MVSGVSPPTGSREAKVAVLPTVAQCAAAKRPATEYASSVPTTPKSAVEIVIPVALDDATPIVPVSAVVQAAEPKRAVAAIAILNLNPLWNEEMEMTIFHRAQGTAPHELSHPQQLRGFHNSQTLKKISGRFR